MLVSSVYLIGLLKLSLKEFEMKWPEDQKVRFQQAGFIRQWLVTIGIRRRLLAIRASATDGRVINLKFSQRLHFKCGLKTVFLSENFSVRSASPLGELSSRDFLTNKILFIFPLKNPVVLWLHSPRVFELKSEFFQIIWLAATLTHRLSAASTVPLVLKIERCFHVLSLPERL